MQIQKLKIIQKWKTNRKGTLIKYEAKKHFLFDTNMYLCDLRGANIKHMEIYLTLFLENVYGICFCYCLLNACAFLKEVTLLVLLCAVCEYLKLQILTNTIDFFPLVDCGFVFFPEMWQVCVFRMGRGGNTGHLNLAGRRQKTQLEHLEVDPLFIRFLRTFKEILKFVLFSYTVLFGALLLARWTTYFIVGNLKRHWQIESTLGLLAHEWSWPCGPGTTTTWVIVFLSLFN